MNIVYSDYNLYIPRIIEQQFEMDAARVACALERYRIKNGVYPVSLKDLSEFLPFEKIPLDWINNQKPHYRVTPEGYMLWCNGWNLQDEGGERFVDYDSYVLADWVWEVKR